MRNDVRGLIARRARSGQTKFTISPYTIPPPTRAPGPSFLLAPLQIASLFCPYEPDIGAAGDGYLGLPVVAFLRVFPIGLCYCRCFQAVFRLLAFSIE